MNASTLRFALLMAVSASCLARASGLSVRATDAGGAPVADAVVSCVPLDAPAPAVAGPSPAPVEVAQVGEEYRPYVTPVLVGTEVSFPNRDSVQHHLYSLSKAKPFEKPLYESGRSESVLFDRPGVVTLGCNIHDWMVAYVVVLETPHFAKTGEDGIARLEQLPPGRYRMSTWHPRLASALTREVEVPAAGELMEAVVLKLRPDRRIRRAPAGEGKAY